MIGTVILCPRCEQGHFTPYRVLTDDEPDSVPAMIEPPQDDAARREQLIRFPYPALSRVAPIYICSPCGTDEAMRDFAQAGPVPPDEWPCERAEFTSLGHTSA